MFKTINKIFPFMQLTKFGIIGISAVLVNYFIVVLLVETVKLNPLIANVFAFLTAFIVSFFGHRHWTFRDKSGTKALALHRFFVISITGFFANEFLFFLLLHFAHLHYTIALIIVLLIIPPLTFLTSKFWGCKYRTTTQ